MDDPLSAVDAHVGEALFKECILDELKHKTVLLATNAVHRLYAADQVSVKCFGCPFDKMAFLQPAEIIDIFLTGSQECGF
jgi:hypothetical protein